MKRLESMIIELCLRPCWKFGSPGFWERLLFGNRPSQGQDRFQAFPCKDKNGPIGWIEIRTAEAPCSSGNRPQIAILAVRASDFIEPK